MAHLLLLWDLHSIKEKHALDLVFAPRLLPAHTQPSPNQTAILQSPSRRNIDPLQLSVTETSAKLPAIHPVPFPPLLFVLGRHRGFTTVQ
jgi:hypothetical protein